MKNNWILICTALFLLVGLSSWAKALEEEENLDLLYEGLYQSIGGEDFDKAIPDDISENLPRGAAAAPELVARLFSLRGFVDLASGGLYRILRSCLSDFSKVFLLVLFAVLGNALIDALQADFAAPAVRFCMVLSLAGASFEVLSENYLYCETVIQKAASLLEVMIPILAAAGLAAGRSLSATLLPASVSTGIALFANFNRSVFLPMLQLYFALAVASAASGVSSLSSICKFFHKILLFSLGFSATLMSGLLTLQKTVAAAADNVATDAAKFALDSVIPVVGSILTDALGTVLGCIRALRTSIGAVGIFVILMLMLPVAIRVLLQSQLFQLAATFGGLFGENRNLEFFHTIASVWSMLAAVTICQGVYLITATALLAA
ncbi:MAG: hypothetical protein IJL15_02515 [Clostridia bacterium]|nr:hypothetical protein [Clostridia bacterium]